MKKWHNRFLKPVSETGFMISQIPVPVKSHFWTAELANVHLSQALMLELDNGESEAIALALQMDITCR